jgi:glyoxylase-like metal-dependent hydrolase (beta-lactamase superfamily II)
MIHEQLVVGPLRCNCHLLADARTREAVVIDPGDDAPEILAVIRRLGLRVVALLHTHAHFDHIGATRELREATGAPVLLHAGDRELYEALPEQVAAFGGMFGLPLGEAREPAPVDRFVEDGDVVRFGREELRVLHTPGHTPGSVCYAGEGRVFTGDTLFRRSIGRTDLPGGDFEREARSILERLYTLDPGTVVYPGHGPETRIGEERAENPFVRE